MIKIYSAIIVQGNKLLLVLLLLGGMREAYGQSCVPLGATPSANQNFVMTLVPRKEFTDVSALSSKNTCEVMQSIQYFDGLGRPLQTVQVKANPDATRDVIVPVAYDQYGREATKYLPYTTGGGTAGSYRANALNGTSGYGNSAQYTFYQQTGQNYSVITYPSASTGFEASPVNRVTEQGAPGAVWQLSGSGVSGSGNTVKLVYSTNDASSLGGSGYPAKQFGVTFNSTGIRTLADNGTYPAGMLAVTISKDENWTSGKNHTTEEYKDKNGHVVLKRTFNNAEILSTYYVYDDFNNLCYVLPPKAEADGVTIGSPVTTTTLNNLCYQYRYDERQRLVEKRVPGSGWQYMVYNKLDQLVYSQDSVQRINHQWSWTKRDALGRVVLTGLENNNSMSRLTLQNDYINTLTGPLWEERTTSRTEGYTARTHPMAGEENSNIVFLSINYYDDYNVPGLPSVYDHQSGNSTMTNGLLTASKVKVLGTTDMLWTVAYYDDEGRNTHTYAQHYLGGTANLNTSNYDHVKNNYDFTGQVTNTIREHYTNNSGTPNLALTVVDSVTYDHMGRKLLSWSQINGGTNVLLSKNEYNEIGQALHKYLHSTTGSAPFLQDVTYAYNERGWLTSASSSKFALNLAYNTGITTGAAAQFNGNIAEMYTTSDHTAANSKMKYTYDALNRLTDADHSNGTLTENAITYDKMGNITALSRSGASLAALAYTYTGNQLTAVTNGGNSFRTYSYDGNGNATTDGTTKGISYNMLNLPQIVTNNNTSATLATYTYTASGSKVRNTGSDGTWDYDNGIVYHNGAIDFVSTEEGRAIPNGGTYSYQYNLKDHLGNDRVSLDNTGVLQEDEYYAFGLRNAKYDNSNNNRYLYNGKEIQVDLANQYDYGARFYDPVIGRWTSVDPLAEIDRRWSPYIYTFGDPIRFTDPDGMWPDWGEIKRTANDLIAGAVNAYASDVTNAEAPTSPHNSATIYNTGRKIGHAAAMLTGGQEMVSGGTAVTEGVAGAPETFGLSLTLSAGGLVMIGHGALTVKNGIVNMVSGKGDDKGKDNSGGQNNNGKNEKHGDSKALTKAEQQIADLKEKISNATGKEKKVLQQKLKNVTQTAQQNAKGVEHSRANKR